MKNITQCPHCNSSVHIGTMVEGILYEFYQGAPWFSVQTDCGINQDVMVRVNCWGNPTHCRERISEELNKVFEKCPMKKRQVKQIRRFDLSE